MKLNLFLFEEEMNTKEYHKMIIDGELVESSSKKYIPIEYC